MPSRLPIIIRFGTDIGPVYSSVYSFSDYGPHSSVRTGSKSTYSI